VGRIWQNFQAHMATYRGPRESGAAYVFVATIEDQDDALEAIDGDAPFIPALLKHLPHLEDQ
jgi:hypothetical protein